LNFILNFLSNSEMKFLRSSCEQGLHHRGHFALRAGIGSLSWVSSWAELCTFAEAAPSDGFRPGQSHPCCRRGSTGALGPPGADLNTGDDETTTSCDESDTESSKVFQTDFEEQSPIFSRAARPGTPPRGAAQRAPPPLPRSRVEALGLDAPSAVKSFHAMAAHRRP
jgi:hypothetical protein